MITVVNMIPRSLSGETNQDSEPNIAVNPANPKQIAASAFTPDPMLGPNAPIYVSTDGGTTWSLNSIVASAGSIGTGDITQRFGGTSNRLYTGILDGATGNFEVHRAANFTSPTVMTELENRANEDQPYVQATTVMGGNGVGTDRVYIGVNDFNAAGGRTATVEQTLDGGAAAPVFTSVRIETRSTLGQDGAQIRPTIHGDGTIYAAFYRWITSTGSFPANTFVITNADVVVVRDDNWGTGAAPFTALTDPSDGASGRRVAIALSFPFNQTGVAARGQERWGGDISIAVDPRNSSTVYLAFSTLVNSVYTLQLVRSLDRGVTWSGNLLSLANAKNPAVAINSLGKVGFVYQQLNGTGATQRWEYHFRDSTNGTTWSDSILCTALSQAPARTFSPYTGDYLHMMAIGKDFYGVFSASNTPDLANFPQGVTFQRNHDFTTKRLFGLDGLTVVNPSIDPFFFKVTQVGTTDADYYVRDWTDSAASHDTGLEPSTNPVFYVTSDVWNQRTNATPTFVNDQPQNQDPQNDATNVAFCRVSRNLTGLAESVNVEFLVAEFGTGSPYVSVANTTVAFAAGDSSQIASTPWTLAPTSSTHLCLAVQVSTISDPFVAPGLNGKTPGWPTTDLVVINDNNKAQRNMSVHYGLAGTGSIHYGLIRNASKKGRDFVLQMTGGEQPVLRKATVRMQGGEAVSFKAGASVTLAGMKPGERRWVALDLTSFAGKVGTSLPVDFREVVDGKVVNAFRINITSAAPARAWLELVGFMAFTFRRLDASFKIKEGAAVAKAARTLAKKKALTATEVTKFLLAQQEAMSSAVERFLARADADAGLDISLSRDAVFAAVSDGKAADVFGATTTLLNKLDIAITLKQPLRRPTT